MLDWQAPFDDALHRHIWVFRSSRPPSSFSAMFLDLLMAPITAPISGIAWIGEQILERASTELDEKENLQKRLLALQLAFDMGEIEEEEFETQEEALLLAIQAMADDEADDEADDAADNEVLMD